jgi:predicted phosphoadenosine phosphosulfate sulfurtransferase
MATIRKKEYQKSNVYEAAKERVHYLYDRFDQVYISFSAGKDSTAVMNIALEVAEERGRLPLKVVFFDEEAIHPPTIEYAKRVAKNPKIDFEWYCLEVKHRNACSNDEPYWYCWDKNKKDLWVRELPEEAITTHPNFKYGESFQEFTEHMFDRSLGNVALLTGVRTQESFRRMKAVSTKKNDNYISAAYNKNLYKCHPIYDWSSEDVWLAVHKFKWDYNETYDIFNKTKLFNKFLQQRVCPPFGEEPLRGLWIYAECFPEMWHKMLHRVSGVATAWRYANTDLYGVSKIELPENVKTWRAYIDVIIESYEKNVAIQVKKNLNALIRAHQKKTDDPISEVDTHPLTGTSWKFICKICIKGDLKGRTAPKLENEAISVRKNMGIKSYEEAKKIYGKKPR